MYICKGINESVLKVNRNFFFCFFFLSLGEIWDTFTNLCILYRLRYSLITLLRLFGPD